ncbi:Glycosyl hydrolases family 16 [Algoriphagus alkaliphilus]|uniref:Glycosyl hydrolases family 16 n=1 Tax=Algoriphagus alkaliphilus TaxID=279824 RepID=A0A1G5YNK3_9BACT|nr:glycoside hydrolase family 16 protein [Algoriphagus alkaliphilus]MBA4300152.1 glycoside hydrolase family 16 protein [Cyclobacterium sp.]SDA83587.1 Glycosyl hydrolases family 16 [Algoriphagus alkaliphilus]
MNRGIQLLSLFFSLILFSSCSEDPTDDPKKLPDNLLVSVDLLGNGLVKANFTADDAVFFKVNFGSAGESLRRVEGNSATHTYTQRGEFILVVQAHSSETDFVVSSQTVSLNAAALGLDPNTGYSSPSNYDGYNLVWADEFNGSVLSSDWIFELGDGCPSLCGWGNQELEYYKKENTSLQNGNLTITAKRENAGSRNYTSSRLITKGNKFFTYGRIDIRAKLPKGQGLWPALWMLGENISEVSWPKCGEIDIMEMIGGSKDNQDGTVHGTVHWDNNGNYANYGGSTKLPFGIFNDEFHVFSINWDQQKIVWLLDGVQYHVIDITPPGLDEFHKPFFFVLNVAVGGIWPGSPDASTVFPQEMKVDYIRVFQKK